MRPETGRNLAFVFLMTLLAAEDEKHILSPIGIPYMFAGGRVSSGPGVEVIQKWAQLTPNAGRSLYISPSEIATKGK